MAGAIRFQGLGGRGGEDAIHIDLQRIGAVREGHGDMVPVRIGDRAGDGVAGAEGTKRQLVAGIEIQLFTAALPEGAVAFAEEMPLGAAQYLALGPQFNRKVRGAEVVGVGIGDRDSIVEAVEGQGLAIGGLAGDPGRAVDQRASVAAARGIGQRGPAPFVHPIGGHEVGHGLGRGRGNVRVIQAQIPGAIHRADAIAVAGAGGQARIAIAVGAGGGDLGKGGAACPLTALHPVASQAAPAAVGRGGPGQIDQSHSGCGNQTSGIRWWRGVEDRQGHTRRVRQATGVRRSQLKFIGVGAYPMILNDDQPRWPGGELLRMGVVVMVQEDDPTEAGRRNGAVLRVDCGPLIGDGLPRCDGGPIEGGLDGGRGRQASDRDLDGRSGALVRIVGDGQCDGEGLDRSRCIGMKWIGCS